MLSTPDTAAARRYVEDVLADECLTAQQVNVMVEQTCSLLEAGCSIEGEAIIMMPQHLERCIEAFGAWLQKLREIRRKPN